MPCLLLLVVFTLALDPTIGLTQFNILELREMTQQGNTSLDVIMGVVMMNLPQKLRSRIRASLSLRTPTNRGFEISSGLGSGLAGSSGPFKFSVPSLQGQASGSSVTTATTSSDTSNDLDPGTVTNIKSDAPILLGAGRKKRSFDIFGNGNFHSNTFHPAGTFGNSGLYGNTGVFHHPRGTYGGHDGYGSSGTYGSVHPGDQNGNLYGGTATGYITYPGSHHSSYNVFHGSGFGGRGSFNRENCPRQADQGFVYKYDNDPLTYPAIEIGNELFLRSLPGSDQLFQALSRQLVFPTDPPEIFIDDFLLSSNVTCQFTEDQVWSYQSQAFTGRCYPLVNFQEVPLYKSCLNRFCKNCGGGKTDFFWGHGATKSANVCVTEYQTVTLWSYCEELLPNVRIVSDRILVPSACTCTTVPCPTPTGSYYHK